MKFGFMVRPRTGLSRQQDFSWVGKRVMPSTPKAPRVRFQCDRCGKRWKSAVRTPSPCCSAPVTGLGIAGDVS